MRASRLDMVTLTTVISKVPLYEVIHPDGAGVDGEIAEVTPAGAGAGEAKAEAAKASRASENCMVLE